MIVLMRGAAQAEGSTWRAPIYTSQVWAKAAVARLRSDRAASTLGSSRQLLNASARSRSSAAFLDALFSNRATCSVATSISAHKGQQYCTLVIMTSAGWLNAEG